jgi:hypothetical protein
MTDKKPKFPLCDKYFEHSGGADESSEEGEYLIAKAKVNQRSMAYIELALSKAEAGTPHKFNSLSYNKGYEQGKLDFVKKLNIEWQNKANPCMKCGSVECSMCYIDFELLIERLKSQIKKQGAK